MRTNHIHSGRGIMAAVLFLLVPLLSAIAQQEELRGLWIDAWGAGIKTQGQIDQLIADAQSANYNALFPQVRKRGDAYYNSLIEPKATDINSGFDPLAYLIQEAHAANPPLEVHAWIVAYPVWSNQSSPPSQSGHVYNQHPSWLTRNSSGSTWDGSAYQLDPGHPGVQEHLFDVAMDIISSYSVDGLQLDYIRYAGTSWGYNPVSVSRFNTIYGQSGQPSTGNSAWRQFRRDQVTALVRKIYLSAMEIDPSVAISAATITWGSGITSTSQWTSSSAYSSVLQDWRAWMEEGILDINIPMTYYNHATHASAYSNWNVFAKNHQYDRFVAIGPGHYLNSISNSLTQIDIARQATSAGNEAQGIVGYSYRVTNKDGIPRSTFLSALVGSGGGGGGANYIVDNNSSGFTASGNWSTGSSASDKYGSNYRFRNVQAVSDAASWTVNIPSSGTYDIYAWWSEGGNRSSSAPYIVDHIGGSTTVYKDQKNNGGQWNLLGTFNLNAGANTVRLSCWTTSQTVVIADAIRWTASSGGSGPFGSPASVPAMTWKTNPQDGHLKGFVSSGGNPVDGASITLTGPENRTGMTDATGFYGFVDLAPGSYTVTATYGSQSDNASVSITAGQVEHEDLVLTGGGGGGATVIVDNSDSGFSASGNWSVTAWASDKYGSNYRYRNTASVSDVATWTANLPSSGSYKVYVWWTESSNRATSAPYFVDYAGGSQLVYADQTDDGGQWNLLGTFQMNAGANTVRLSCWTSSGSVVIADAIKWEKQ